MNLYLTLAKIACVSLAYLLLIPFQVVFFPSNYFSIRDIIYHHDLKKAYLSAASRYLTIFIMCFAFRFVPLTRQEIIAGIVVGSIMCVWPSVYHYKLFLFWKNKGRSGYFFGCIFSVLFSLLAVLTIEKLILPAIFDGKSSFVFSNEGIQLIYSIVLICIPVTVRNKLEKSIDNNPFLEAQTYPVDIYLTEQMMSFEEALIEQNHYEISKASREYNVPFTLIRNVLLLEYINRGLWYQRLIEKIVCRLFPQYAIKRDISIGLAQIKISTAHDYYKCSPKQYISKMLQDSESIQVCAWYLRQLLDNDYYDEEFFIECPDFPRVGDENRWRKSLYIASKYVCGCDVCLMKHIFVYATILETSIPDDIGNG